MKNLEKYYEEISKMSLPDLESRIKELHSEFDIGSASKYNPLKMSLEQRKELINENFVFTPEAVRHIERVNRILTECTSKVMERTILLYRQMLQLGPNGDDFVNGFMVEGTVNVSFNSPDSLLVFEVDENQGQSDYETMAEILDDERHEHNPLHAFRFVDYDQDAFNVSDDELIDDRRLKRNWNIELLSAPELSYIETFCYASHALFCHSNYSLSDIIRINDFWNEVKVTHQHIVKT